MHGPAWGRLAALAAALGAVCASGAGAQTLSILDSTHVQLITQEVSGDAAYEHIRFMTQFHRPRGGAEGLWRVAQYYEEQARAVGLADVKLIKQKATGRPWNARSAELWIVEPRPERIASLLQTPLHLADNSRAADVTAELVDVGAGSAAELDAKSVAGKVVLTYGGLGAVMREAVVKRGAAGVVWYPSPFDPGNGIAAPSALPDQIRWSSIPGGQVDGKEPTFAFILSLRQGIELRNRLANAKAPVRVRAQVDAGFASAQGDEPWQVMVEAFIRGTEGGLGQDVVLTGHLQEEKFSANDDGSGTASVLEVARALSKLIAAGALPRPRRDLRFWWVTEISSQRQYFADDPEAQRRMWVNVNQDMVGADQSLDVMRKQNVTRLPATRFHFFNDVVEAVVDYMVAGNTSELAQVQAGFPLYPRPHLAHLGTDHRYNAEVIFFHNNTDHMTFNEAPIGVPATTFTNMPDRYIHSSDDDLWNLDRTQLGRSAASVALIAYAMASADAAAVPALAAETVGRGAERLARNLRLGLSWIATSPDRARAYLDAVDQIRYAADRERRALRSLAQVDARRPFDPAPSLAALERREREMLRDLEAAYRSATRSAPPRPAPGADEQRLAALRPALAGGPAEFLTRRGQVEGVPGLHDLMAFEVLNAVDGRRTGLDIYRLVAAEAREAGSHYYGEVTAAAVAAYLENLRKAGLVALSSSVTTSMSTVEVISPPITARAIGARKPPPS